MSPITDENINLSLLMIIDIFVPLCFLFCGFIPILSFPYKLLFMEASTINKFVGFLLE